MKPITIILGLLILGCVACTRGAPVPLPVKVLGTTMEPALHDGDRIVVIRNPDQLARGDIVLFHYPHAPEKSYIKRIIGLPRERVSIRDGKVFVDNKLLEEPYVDARNNQGPISYKEINIPEGSYYVMGDNRDNSADSRIYGAIGRSFIYGKFVAKYFAAK